MWAVYEQIHVRRDDSIIADHRLWRTIYLAKLPGIQKKMQVGLAWLLDLFFAKNIVQYRLSRVVELYRMSDVQR
jgi:hypothetical protein